MQQPTGTINLVWGTLCYILGREKSIERKRPLNAPEVYHQLTKLTNLNLCKLPELFIVAVWAVELNLL